MQIVQRIWWSSYSPHISQCKKWVAGGQHHNTWSRRKNVNTANINVHQDVGVKQLMAQQFEFQKSMIKQMSRFSGKKGKARRGRAIHTTPTRTLVPPIEVLGPATTVDIIFACPKIMMIDHLN